MSRGVFRVPIKVIVIDIHLKGCMSFKIIGINKEGYRHAFYPYNNEALQLWNRIDRPMMSKP